MSSGCRDQLHNGWMEFLKTNARHASLLPKRGRRQTDGAGMRNESKKIVSNFLYLVTTDRLSCIVHQKY